VNELESLATAEGQVRSKRGGNIIGAVLWLPGYVYSRNDAARALRLIDDRRSHLNSLRLNRNCR